MIKLRVARKGQGRSGRYRTIIAYKARHRAFFLYGFAKSGQDNLTPDELQTARKIAADLLSAEVKYILRAVQTGEIQEIGDDDEED